MWFETLDFTRYDTLARGAAGMPVDRSMPHRHGDAANDTGHATGAPPCGRRVLLLGDNKDHQLGYRAMLQGLCESLQRADPGVRITIRSARSDPGGIPGVVRVLRHGIGAYPALLAAARAQDLVILADDAPSAGGASRMRQWYRAARLRLLGLCNPHIRSRASAAGTAEVTPDPAFALTAAPGDAADRYLRSIGLSPCEPLIGVVMRLPGRMSSAWSFGHASADLEISRLLDQAARGIETLARHLDASVLFLPTCNGTRGADSQYCHELAAMLELPSVRVASVQDPALYKAVCGRLKLMLSARSLPLILAAGMGVPGVAFGGPAEFAGYFGMFGMPQRRIGFDELHDGLQPDRLVELATAALADRTDLRTRSALLRRRVDHDVAALLEPPASGAGP
jgi:hypothetical protein